MKLVSFLFPVHNESKRILKVKLFMDWVKKKFPRNSYSFVFLLNDCTDNTEILINNNFKKYPIILIKSKNKKRGSVLNLAFKNLKKKTKFFGICSVDNAWSFNFYTKAYSKIKRNHYSIIYGPKSHENSKVKTNLTRKIISGLSRIYLRILFGEWSQDTQCIKFFKSNINFLDKLHDYNYFAETEFYLNSKKNEVRYFNLAVKVKNDNKNSKINLFKIFYYMYECLHFRFKYFKE